MFIRKSIPEDLLSLYVRLCRDMGSYSRINVNAYYIASKQRCKVHNKILDAVGTNRNDKDFAFQLACFVEDTLCKG